MFKLLLAIKQLPAFDTQYLSICLEFNTLKLLYKFIPEFGTNLNHVIIIVKLFK